MANVCSQASPWRFRGGAILAAVAALVFAGPAFSKGSERVGRIIVEGNVNTPDGVILKVLNLYPGQKLEREEVKRAERALQDLGLFREDPTHGVYTTVTVLPSELDSEFKDIVVHVNERSWTWIVFDTQDWIRSQVFWDMDQLDYTAQRVRSKLRPQWLWNPKAGR